MSSENGCTLFCTFAFYFMFWHHFTAFVFSVVFSFHTLHPRPRSKLYSFLGVFYVGSLVLMYHLPSLLGPNSCKIVKFISAACQKYKNTASFLFSCVYLFLSAHPIFDNEDTDSRHAMALCAASTAAIIWVKLSGSGLKASLIFACWFVPASIVAFMFLFGTHDLIIYWPTVVAVFTPFVPVDYRVLFRARLKFNKPAPPSGRCRNDIEMPPDRETKAHGVKIEPKYPHGSVREGKKDDDKKTETEHLHGSVKEKV